MKYYLFTLFLIFNTLIYSQSISEGEALFNSKQYVRARTVYEELLKKKPRDGLYNYRFARCCYELNDAENAITHFEQAGIKYPLRNLYLGELYFNTYRFEESALAYQSYITTLKPTDTKISDYLDKIKKAENAGRLFTRIEDVSITDSMVVNKDAFLKFYKFNSELGSLTQESIRLKGNRKADKIKYMTQRQDRVCFSDSVNGKMNIFTSYKLLDSWSQPVSLSGMIPSHGNDNYPFLQADGVTIYYASDGDNSMGGYDLFITRYNPTTDSYLAPENIGMPFNSPFNDYMMVIDDQRKVGWFATDRYQPAGKVMIYTFIPNEVKIIVHSEDKDYLRLVAQLKTYRRVAASVPDSAFLPDSPVQVSKTQFEFVLNDTTIYTKPTQFKSKEALKLWSELQAFSTELNTKTKELSDLRSKYARSEKESERSAISPVIVELEKKNMEMKKMLTQKLNQIRKTELDFLVNKK